MHPTRIGRYEIHSLLGQGGMGTVYRGRDPAMERWVAIKTVTVQDAHQRARFQQEVRAAGGLNHPHITTIYDVGEQDELAYIVMELVDGQTLVSRLASPVPWPETVNLLLPICQALAYAHSRGVIHRDVKPANILISTEGQAKLSDFGVARLEAALRRITESGSTVGTPLYTSPEQIRNEPVDGRTDLFSLGVVLFELTSGQHPFMADTLAQVIYRITQPQPANLDALTPLAPPAVIGLVGRALAKQATARFSDADEMAAAMTACLAQPDVFHPPPPPKSLAGASAVSTPGPVIDLVASNISLSPTEEALLKTAFAGHDRLYLEREFSSGYSGARVLLATPVRSGGRRLAQVVLKLDAPAAIEQEWQAYQKYVRDTLPPVTARILEEPLRAPDGQLALLRYTFAGGLGHSPPESLQTYYAQHEGQEVAALLEKSVFRAFGSKWWLQRKTTDLILRREYDRLLPVHLVLAYRDFNEITATARNLVAGQVTTHTCSELESGQLVQIQAFRVEEVHPKQNEATLQAWPPSGSHTNPIRVRVTGLPAHRSGYQVGQVVSSLVGVVTATRREHLFSLARAAFPNQDLELQQLSFGGELYPNPLLDYETLLDQRLSVMTSIIHGDLNLDNILVTPTSGVAWLIDFATTREGHNLYDFMRLETQVLTKLIAQTRAGPEAVAHLMIALHQPETAMHQVPVELRQSLLVLQAIRRMVRICLYSRDNWDEYYLGLVITLLGALKFKELDPRTRGIIVAAAAAVRSLIELPTLRTVRPAPVVATVSRPIPIRPIIFGAIGLLLLAILSALGFGILGGQPTPTVEPTPTGRVIAAPKAVSAHSQPASPTSTLSPSPSPTSIVVEATISVGTTPLPPTAAPTPPPTVCSSPTFFTDLLKDYPDLGCALEHWRSDFDVQQFERGLMVWRKSPEPAQIYVLLDQGDWRSYDDPHGPATPFCPEAQQTGGLGPIFSFGVIWCSEELERIGLPVTGEMEARASPVEDFESGLVFRLDQTSYVLLDDRKQWLKVSSSPATTPLPSPTPCQTDPAQEFEALWNNFSSELGCPTGFPTSLPFYVEEAFEGGHMFWREDTNDVYVVFDRQKDGTELLEGDWQKPPWKWDGAAVCRRNLSPPPNLYQPDRGFGWLWCTHLGGSGGLLGWALEKEQGFTDAGFAQQFEQGVAFKGINPKTYALLDNGHFLAFSPPLVQPTPIPPLPPTKPTFQDTGFRPANVFVALWDSLDGGQGPLGYPLGGAITTQNYARQPFERGFMFWWEAPDNPKTIWVIDMPDPTAAQGESWNRYQDRWDPTQPAYPPGCLNAVPPLGPRHGFGRTWCEENGVQSRIGRPIEEEFGSGNAFPKGAFQYFQGGFMFEVPIDRQVWALIEGDGWHRANY